MISVKLQKENQFHMFASPMTNATSEKLKQLKKKKSHYICFLRAREFAKQHDINVEEVGVDV